jgi:ABC-type hemin transport system ATPase subunit
MFTVVESMNAHDAVTVRSDGTNATYHLVAYADESTHREVSSLSAGESARLSLSRVGDRANVWRADAAAPQPVESAGEEFTAGD